MNFKVTVRVRPLDGFENAYFDQIYSVYGNTPEDAANSLVVQRKVKSKDDIISVALDELY